MRIPRYVGSRELAVVFCAFIATFALAGIVAASSERSADVQSNLISNEDFHDDTARRASRGREPKIEASTAPKVVDMAVVQTSSTYLVDGTIQGHDERHSLWIVARAGATYHFAKRVKVDRLSGRFMVTILRNGSPSEFEYVLVQAIPSADLSGYFDNNPSSIASLPDGTTVVSTLHVFQRGDTRSG